MNLTRDEQAMLQGRDGRAIAKAMDLLCRYGEALDAERLIDTKNVAGTVAATTPFMRDFAQRKGGMDATFSEFNLDSDETVTIWIGEIVQERVPVVIPAFNGSGGKFSQVPNLQRLKHFGASASSSDGVKMYHLLGVTPRAPDEATAFGGNAPAQTLVDEQATGAATALAVQQGVAPRHVDVAALQVALLAQGVYLRPANSAAVMAKMAACAADPMPAVATAEA